MNPSKTQENLTEQAKSRIAHDIWAKTLLKLKPGQKTQYAPAVIIAILKDGSFVYWYTGKDRAVNMWLMDDKWLWQGVQNELQAMAIEYEINQMEWVVIREPK